jgi:hypothetical protein
LKADRDDASQGVRDNGAWGVERGSRGAVVIVVINPVIGHVVLLVAGMSGPPRAIAGRLEKLPFGCALFGAPGFSLRPTAPPNTR